MQTRIPSAKKLPSLDETSASRQAAVVGKFSDMASGSTSSISTDAAEDQFEMSDSVSTSLPLVNQNKVKGVLTRTESQGALRRGTPRPQELKKTLSTVKFVLENSGLDQVEEEDFEMC
jgi:hypothetical protein